MNKRNIVEGESMRINKDLLKKMREKAGRDRRSIKATIEMIIENAIRDERNK